MSNEQLAKEITLAAITAGIISGCDKGNSNEENITAILNFFETAKEKLQEEPSFGAQVF